MMLRGVGVAITVASRRTVGVRAGVRCSNSYSSGCGSLMVGTALRPAIAIRILGSRSGGSSTRMALSTTAAEDKLWKEALDAAATGSTRMPEPRKRPPRFAWGGTNRVAAPEPVEGQVVLYKSQPSWLARGLAGFLSLQAVSTWAGAAFLITFEALDVPFESVVQVISDPVMRAGLILGVVGGVLQVCARKISEMIVTSIVQRTDENGKKWLTVEKMGMLKSGEMTFPKEWAHSASPRFTFQHFQVQFPDELTPRRLILLPKSWYTEDIQQLKDLMHSDYYRPEQRMPTGASLMHNDGFVYFRPAQLADPHHPAAQATQALSDEAMQSAGFTMMGPAQAYTKLALTADGARLQHAPYQINAEGRMTATETVTQRVQAAARAQPLKVAK